MMYIEPKEFAPKWAEMLFVGTFSIGWDSVSAVGWIRTYDGKAAEMHTSLRDRSDEMAKALHGFSNRAGGVEDNLQMIELMGADLKPYGMDIVGAQYGQMFKVFFKK